MGLPTQLESQHPLRLLLSRARQSKSLLQKYQEQWSTQGSRPCDIVVSPLQLEVPQSFYAEVDRLHISPQTLEQFNIEISNATRAYANTFEANCRQLLTKVDDPNLKVLLPSVIEALRSSFQKNFEARVLSVALKQLRAHSAYTVVPDIQPRFNKEYIPFLEKYYVLDAYPSIRDQEVMAEKSGMTRRQIEVWFQNRRRISRKQGIAPTRRQQGGSAFPEDPKSFVIDNLPPVLREASPMPQPTANTIEIVEHLVSQETELDRLDFDPARKYESVGRPRYSRDLNTSNPLDSPTTLPVPLPFKPSSSIPEGMQFRNLPARPHFSLPTWDRKPYVAPNQPAPLRKKGKSSKKVPPTQQEIEEMDKLINEFEYLSINRGRKEENTPERHKRDYDVPSTLPPAATYATTVVPPTGRHPALCWHPSQLTPAPTPTSQSGSPPVAKEKRKKAGLPNRKPKSSPRRSRVSPAPSNASTMRSSLSRSPSPNASSRTPSLESSGNLHRHASSSSLSSLSEVDTPLFTPVALPTELPPAEIAPLDLSGLDESFQYDYNVPFGFAPSGCDFFGDLFGNSTPTTGQEDIWRTIGAQG
ncbi:hypothetical protein VNI00_002028 [Paramarasmius palmivorus]|uniref:Homeobox domain-containing protein n=1 Tax=Paramarasmius palmivorus TaxID=297713 RepID=A0AAW0E2M6_9AGAR